MEKFKVKDNEVAKGNRAGSQWKGVGLRVTATLKKARKLLKLLPFIFLRQDLTIISSNFWDFLDLLRLKSII